MGGVSSAEVTAETRVSKQQAMAAVVEAFRGKPPHATVSIKDIAVEAAQGSDPWKTTSHKMNQWRAQGKPTYSGFGTTGEALRDSGLGAASAPPGRPSAGGGTADWSAALEAGALTKSQRIERLRSLFDALDQDDDHVVSKREFIAALASKGVGSQEAAALFNEMDESRTGTLTLAKFDHYAAIHTLMLVKELFRNVDTAPNRQIEKKEFKLYFMSHGLSRSQAHALWDSMDLNRNGRINFIEFRDRAGEILETQSLEQVAVQLGLVS